MGPDEDIFGGTGTLPVLPPAILCCADGPFELLPPPLDDAAAAAAAAAAADAL